MRETTAVAQTAGALGSTRFWVAEQFPEHLTTVMGLLGDERVETSAPSATPAASSFPQVWLLRPRGRRR